jgi:hypothetical protein
VSYRTVGRLAGPRVQALSNKSASQTTSEIGRRSTTAFVTRLTAILPPKSYRLATTSAIMPANMVYHPRSVFS